MQSAHGQHEPRWHAGIAVVAALLLYVTLPPKLVIGPLWLLPLLVLGILIPLIILAPKRHDEAPWQRIASNVHVAILNAFNVATVVVLVQNMLEPHGHKTLSGGELLLAAVEIWLTNAIIYALWYWEIDGRGPDARAHGDPAHFNLRADFLFPQMALAAEIRDRLAWRARFIDYVFLSFNTATAFSPTDTFPLTPLAKILMMAESATSLVTVAVIAGRAINILAG
jgi:hypothetical protein